MLDKPATARITLYGRFRFEAAGGQDLAPKSAKSQALLALLATSETGSRGRLWLQKRLWPAGGADKSSVSLRQALSEIRRALGDDRDLLQADRRSAALDLSRVTVAKPVAAQEFLEGIELADGDQVARDWLDHHRRSVAQTVPVEAPRISAPPPKPVVAFQARSGPGSELNLIEDIFIDCVARSLREMLSAEVRVGAEAAGVAPNVFRVEVQAYRGDGASVGVRARVRHGDPELLVWSGLTTTQLHGAPPVEDLQIVSLGNQLIDALADAMTVKINEAREFRDANLLTRLAVRRIFWLKPEALLEADDMLAHALELGAGALAQAWRAQVRVIQHVELHPGRSENLHEEARRFGIDALEREPQNSMVLAAVANTRLVLEKDISACMELARRSVSLNPANPLAWNSLATAKLYAGEFREAHLMAARAHKMSSGSPFGHWWDFGRCLTAALTGRGDEAIRLAEAAHAMSPEFRPPIRYLTALYAAADRPDDAWRMGDRLAKLEPDFSFERLATDESYPVSPLRWSGLLDPDRLLALSGS